MSTRDPIYSDLDRELERRERAERARSGRAIALRSDLIARYRSLDVGHPAAATLLDIVDLLNDLVQSERDISHERDAELRGRLL